MVSKKTVVIGGVTILAVGTLVGYGMYESSKHAKQSEAISSITASASTTSVSYTSSSDLFDITGNATDSNGNGVPNATVYLWGMNTSESSPTWNVLLSTTTNKDGSFDFSVPSKIVTPGDYIFYVSNQNKTAPPSSYGGVPIGIGRIKTRGTVY